MIIKPFFTEFRFTQALRQVSLFSFIASLYTLLPLTLHYTGWFEKMEKMSIGLETSMMVILSALLVFRANRAYERWWEARGQWGSLVNVSRKAALKINSFIKLDEKESATFAMLIGKFPFVLLHHLRGTICKKELSKKITIPENVTHLPLYINALLYEKLRQLQQQKRLSEIDFLMIDKELSQFMEVVGRCEKIKSTLISLSYRCFVHHIMVIVFIFLPWRFVDSYGIWSVPLVFLSAYITFALEGIARNLEEPFGVTSDDVAMASISKTIQQSVNQAFCCSSNA